MHLMHLKSLLCPMRFTLDCKHLESRDDITNILIWPSACSPVNAYIHCCCVTSVVSNSMWPQRRQPTRLRRPWDSPGKNTGVGCHLLLQCIKVKSESEVAQLCPTRSDPMDCSPPGSSWWAGGLSSMGFSRQEYWSGVPLPSPSCFMS